MAAMMANTGRGERKKGKPQKQNLRVDFTPMVDMNMLLITFFMFCTTFAKPQIMDIVMPTKDTSGGTVTPESRTTTLILGENSKIYYFHGMPDYTNPDFLKELKETDFSAKGIRSVLLDRNAKIVTNIRELAEKRHKEEISEEKFKEEVDKLKNSDSSQTILIKPSEKSKYDDLVSILDEVRICNISKYAVVDITSEDNELMKKYIDERKLAQK